MVRIIEIDIGLLGLQFPRGEVGMVIAQPYVDLVLQEPFPINPQLRDAALAGIDATLAVALSRVHGADKTHFTIFPECTLPGLDAFDRITKIMEGIKWPTGTVVIGGLEGLTRADFSELIQRPNTIHDKDGNSLERIRDDQWVNCCVTWAKLDSGEVCSWIQPKIEPAWVERNVNYQSMFQGRSIYLFKGTYSNTNLPYRFATLICFDWIGTHGERRVWEWLLDNINQTASAIGAVLPLTWLFVTQFNPAPSHASFMSQIQPFFTQSDFPNVLRDDTCLVMANVAGNALPGVAEDFGRSAVIFSNSKFMRPTCAPTYCNGGEPQRPGDPLENFKDAVFRERGACIHSFRQFNPNTLAPGAAGRTCALADPTVHPFPDTNDPRTPNGLVPAEVKWVNDELDDSRKSLMSRYRDAPLANSVGVAHERSVDAIRWLSATALSNTILAASPSASRVPDEWLEAQSQAVEHILHTFSILQAAAYPTTFHGAGAHATIMNGKLSIEVLAVIGRSHEECDRHLEEKLPSHRGQLLLISRDQDNTSWDPRMRSIFDQDKEPSKELNITDPSSAVVRVGYCDVLKAYREAVDQTTLREAIDAAIF